MDVTQKHAHTEEQHMHTYTLAVQLFISMMALVLPWPSNHTTFTFQIRRNAALPQKTHRTTHLHTFKHSHRLTLVKFELALIIPW